MEDEEPTGDGGARDVDALVRELREQFHERHPEPCTELVEAGRVRDFLLAMDEPPDMADGDPVPPLFLLTLGRTRRPQPSRGSAVNGGDEFEFHRPVHVGDRITVTRRLRDIEQKRGRRGPLFITHIESTYTNQRDELVAVSRQVLIRWGL